jgi:N-acetylmuramic acid 6-phosphate (MurNAc-6-P) etherase
LNTISTGAMTLAGFVYEGRMVHMRPVNAKLRRRAVAMVVVLANVDEGRARALLAKADDRIAVAVAMALKGWTAEEAAENLVQARWNLREALRHA